MKKKTDASYSEPKDRIPAQLLTVQERIHIAKSLFGILTPDITLEQAKEELLNKI